jgi:hypothetical protein
MWYDAEQPADQQAQCGKRGRASVGEDSSGDSNRAEWRQVAWNSAGGLLHVEDEDVPR